MQESLGIQKAAILEIFAEQIRRYDPKLEPTSTEIEYLQRSLRNGIALRAVSLAMEHRHAGDRAGISTFIVLSQGGFAQLSEQDLAAHLEHSSGLPFSACKAALAGLWTVAIEQLQHSASVLVEGIGAVRRNASGEIALELDRDLAIAATTKHEPSRAAARMAQRA